MDAIQPTVRIRFKKNTKSAIYISSYSFLQGDYKQKFSEVLIGEKNYHKDQILSVILATVPKAEHINATFEARDSNGKKYDLMRNSRNQCEIEIGGTKSKFIIETLSSNSGACGVCHLINGEQDLFKKQP